jgi:two-component system NarL family response regulator
MKAAALNRECADPFMKACATPTPKIIRVLIADDHPVVREGLAAILQCQPDMTVVAEAADGEQTLELYDECSPDVLILDLRMPELDGLQVLTELMSRGDPKPRVLVMTAYASEENVRRALKTGAKGFLVKGADPQQIREAVREIAAGQAFLPAKIVSKLADSIGHPELSPRELQVLHYLARGKSNKEVGQILYITENTVKGHVKAILTKLEAMGRTEAIAIATSRGLVPMS